MSFRRSCFLFALFVLSCCTASIPCQADWDEFSPGSASGGGITKGNADPFDLRVALDENGSPLVVWNNRVLNESQLYAMRWDGRDWVAAGQSGASGLGFARQILRISQLTNDPSDGKVVVSAHHYQNYLYKFDGREWQPWLDGMNDGDGLEFDTTLGFLPDQTPIGFYRHGVSDVSHMRLRKSIRSRWVDFSEGSGSGNGIADTDEEAHRPNLAVTPFGTVYALWTQEFARYPASYLLMKVWNGSDWFALPSNEEIPGVFPYPSDASFKAVALDHNYLPIVVGASPPDHFKLYAQRYDGRRWVEMGSGSRSGNGLSSDGELAHWPIVVNNYGRHPVLLWRNLANDRLYARRFDGAEWQPAGIGSASGDGLGSVFDKAYDAVMNDDGLVIAAYVNENKDIYVKKFESGSIPAESPAATPTPLMPPEPTPFPTPTPTTTPPPHAAPQGWLILDGYGGIHANQRTVEIPDLPYFEFFDIARDIEPDPLGRGWYMLDGYGGIHPSSPDLPMPDGLPYFGFDIARNLEIVAENGGLQFYLLDGHGTVHTTNGNFDYSNLTWFGFDIARDLEPDEKTGGWFVLDGYGVLHGSKRRAPLLPLRGVWSTAPYLRSIVIEPDDRSIVLDAFAGIHTNPLRPSTLQVSGFPPEFYFPGFDIIWDIEAVPGEGQ